MTEETKTEASTEQQKQDEVKLSTEQPEDAKKISVDIGGGVAVELDIEQGKKWIQFRDSRTKGFKELEAKLKSAEDAAKNEASRAQLLEAIKTQNLDEVETQVSAKYKDTISKFEKKVYHSSIESTLSKLGLVPEALSDATKLVLADAKPELDGDDIKLNGVKAEDYLKEWVAKKPHLKAVASSNKKETIKTINKLPQETLNPFLKLTKGISKLHK
jgi:hypothetical protein